MCLCEYLPCVRRYLWNQKGAVESPGARGPGSSELIPASLWNVTVLLTETHRAILPTSWPLSFLAVSPFDSVPFAQLEFHFSYKLGVISKQHLRAQILLTSSSKPSSLPHQ